MQACELLNQHRVWLGVVSLDTHGAEQLLEALLEDGDIDLSASHRGSDEEHKNPVEPLGPTGVIS